LPLNISHVSCIMCVVNFAQTLGSQFLLRMQRNSLHDVKSTAVGVISIGAGRPLNVHVGASEPPPGGNRRC